MLKLAFLSWWSRCYGSSNKDLRMPQFCVENVLQKQNFAVEMFCKNLHSSNWLFHSTCDLTMGCTRLLLSIEKLRCIIYNGSFSFDHFLPIQSLTYFIICIWPKKAWHSLVDEWSEVFSSILNREGRPAKKNKSPCPTPWKCLKPCTVCRKALKVKKDIPIPDTLRYTERTGLMWGFRNWFQKFNFPGLFWEKAFFGRFFFLDPFLVGWTLLHQSAWNFSPSAKIYF